MGACLWVQVPGNKIITTGHLHLRFSQCSGLRAPAWSSETKGKGVQTGYEGAGKVFWERWH